MAEEKLGLRERKKLDTRKALSDAAFELIFERGLDNVVREDIAARAGVSVRTFNNYFNGKFDALAYRQIERIQRTVKVLRARPADEPIWTAITAAVLEPLENDGLRYAPVPTPGHLAEVRKFATQPEIQGAFFGSEVFGDLIAAIAERTGTDPVHDLYPRLVVGTVHSAYSAAMHVYIHADPPMSIIPLLEQAFEAIADGLPAPR
ncbi:TetR family transcriptional regulator [Nocardia arthritidis]|uniref:TetR family transcriptional regulator n=1 Tax=Nocardia arthritidis TaxID=228602 RepID=A0A6G9YIZ2_9NOCA|nr:TetR family transcriptional regulator [Nocardia arthritidis]QIS13161.1 TetR family transcriptional regulator [Nocardia arthritidis]